eukprot:GILI01000378.1.p2 GENE.GILI01000378.1~~GILI01000378.1.p2  ORF type:complete len:427 (+),score=198.48 GILI01000378.1:54-1334(+)
MRSVVAFAFLALFCTSAFAARSSALETQSSKLLDTIAQKLKADQNNKINSMFNGALDTVIKMLGDLKEGNEKEQAEADARNVTEQQECDATIATLRDLVASTKKTYEDAEAHLQFLNDEYKDTEAHLKHIADTKAANAAKLEQLSVDRCQQNAIFVKQVREHKEAAKILQALRGELTQFLGGSSFLEHGSVQSLADKMKQYRSIFGSGLDAVLAEFEQPRALEADNDQGALQRADTSNLVGQRKNLKGSLLERLTQLLMDLEKSMKDSIEDLINKEIKAADDFAEYQIHLEEESKVLDAAQARKEAYKKKLDADIPVAQDYVAKTLVPFEDAKKALASKKAECEHKSAYYASENQRRATELSTIVEVINIFKTRVSQMKEELKLRVEQGVAGQDFSDAERLTHTQDATKELGSIRNRYEQTGGFTA